MITQTTTQKSVTTAVVTAFGPIITALKMATGKSVTEQQQIWSFALAVAVFGDHYDYDKEEYSCGDFETVTTDELLEKVNSFEEKEGEYIEFK